MAPEETLSDEELIRRFPGQLIDHDNKAFFRGWLRRELLLNRCAECGLWHHPPQPVCPSCWSSDVRATPVSGRGTVHMLIRLHQGPPAPGVDYSAGPYPVAVVELAEQAGLRFTSTVVGEHPVRIGSEVALDWIDRAGSPFPVFRPLEGSDAA